MYAIPGAPLKNIVRIIYLHNISLELKSSAVGIRKCVHAIIIDPEEIVVGIRSKVNVFAYPLIITIVQQYEKYRMYTIARIIYNNSSKHPNDKFHPQRSVEYLSAWRGASRPCEYISREMHFQKAKSTRKCRLAILCHSNRNLNPGFQLLVWCYVVGV